MAGLSLWAREPVSNANSEHLRSDCWNRALYAFGTAYLFERRAKRFGDRLRWVTFLGILVPLLVGGVILSFGTQVLPFMLIPAGAFSVVQLVLSAWALVAKWDDSLAYARESTADNYQLASEFEQLARTNPPEIAAKAELLRVREKNRTDADLRQDLSNAEKSAGLRAALIQFQRPCAACKNIPASMVPSDCRVCGNFPSGDFM